MSYDRRTFVTNPEMIPKLEEILALLNKKTKRGDEASNDVYYFSVNSFKKSSTVGKRSVSLMNECLLNHRFEEAAKLLWVMCQDRSCFDLVLYKGIMVVLENLISSNEIQITKRISSDITKLKLVNKLDIQLEYLIYVLKNDIHSIEDSFYLEAKNARKRTFKAIPYIQQLFSAYSALVSYIKWVNISQGGLSSKDEKDIAFNIIATFKQLIDNPGIWDIFVLKLIEVLEHYEEYDQIEEVLKKYVERNPGHVNAYIYLCVHLHKYNVDSETFIHYAKKLADLCPSDERVLLLVQKWNELGEDLKKCLKILFKFLDYPVNGSSILAWQLLSSVLHKASDEESSLTNTIKSCWKLRNFSWNYMYFKSSSMSTELFELISCKAKVLSILEPGHEYIKHLQEKFPEKTIPNEILSPQYEDFKSVYHVNGDVSR